MSGSVNKVILIGRLGADPDVRYLPSGDAMAIVSMATSERWKDKTSGEAKEKTEWHRIVFWKPLAEVVGQYLKKGAQIYVEGQLQTRKWEGDDGQTRYTTEIRARVMTMLGSRAEGAAPGAHDRAKADGYQSQGRSGAHRGSQEQGGFDDGFGDPDLPF